MSINTHVRKMSISAIAMLAMSSPAFATICHDRTIETLNNASRIGLVGVGGGSVSQSGGSNYSSLLALCQNPDHPFYAKMTETGACTRTGSELVPLASFASPTSAYSKDFKDGDVPDYDQRRYGFYIHGYWIGTDWKGGPGNSKSC